MPAGVHLPVVDAAFDVKNNLGGCHVAVAPPAECASAEICHASGGRRQRIGTDLPEDLESGIGVWSWPGARWLQVHDGAREVLGIWYPDRRGAEEAHRARKAAELHEVNVLYRRSGRRDGRGWGGRRRAEERWRGG